MEALELAASSPCTKSPRCQPRPFARFSAISGLLAAADAAAEKAVARLGATRGLEIRGTVLTIPSLLRR